MPRKITIEIVVPDLPDGMEYYAGEPIPCTGEDADRICTVNIFRRPKPLTGWAWVESLPNGTRFYAPETRHALIKYANPLGNTIIMDVSNGNWMRRGYYDQWREHTIRSVCPHPCDSITQWIATLNEESCRPDRPKE